MTQGIIAFLAILGTAHILVRTASYGTGVGTDSIAFLSTAINFLAGEGWRHFADGPMVGWPPLFPLLMAALGWVGIEPLEAGRWVNATAFGLTILTAGLWLHSNLRSQWLALAATATLVASLPLSHWATSLMTDPLFVLFTLLALIQLAAFLQRGEQTPLLWGAVFTALAALTRYPGVALIGTGVLMLLPLARLRQTLAFGAISSLPLLAVLVRNWTVSKTLTGRDTKGSGQSLSEGLSQTVEVFRAWVVPPNAPDGLAYLLWLAVGLVGLAGAVVVLRGGQPHPEAAPAYFRLEPALPFAVFALIYLVLMIAVVPLTVGQPIDSRYLLPVYVPLLLTAVFLLDRFLSITSGGWMAATRYGLASLVLLASLVHIGCSARENLRLTAQGRVAGYGYNNARWQHSETMNYIRDHRMEGRILSNHTPLAWFANRIAAPDKYRDLALSTKRLKAGEHIILFREFHNRDIYGYDFMDVHILPGVEPVAELADGVVYRVTATVVEPFDAKRHRAHKQRYVQQLLEQAGERVVHAGWDVYRNGRTLTYRKQPCAPDDVQANFVLHVIPDDPADLPAARQQYGYENLGFNFHTRGGLQLDDQCVVTTQLPVYPISRISIGRWIAKEDRTVLGAEFSGAGDSSYGESSAILKYIRDHRMDGPIYSNHHHLAWFWDRTAAPGKHQPLPDEIHLLTSAIMQSDDSVLILWLRRKSLYDYNYNDLDLRLLPGVEPVAELSDGVVFRVTTPEPFDAGRHRARKQRYVQQLIQQTGERVVRADSTWPISFWGAQPAGEQVTRAGWDVYRNGRTLTYRKQPCTPDDVQTNFVLQVSPVDRADLSAHRRPSGFDNLDFHFHIHGGVRLDDQCVAIAQLPDYSIDRIYIGRWIAGNSRTLWDMKFSGSR